MPFRAVFDCLWCGTPYRIRAPGDLEGFAQLCPACIGKAGTNGFLRFRLRAALEERAAAARGARADEPGSAVSRDAPDDLDDWYLRRGRFDLGSIERVAWQAELDAATLWLDRLPLGGVIVEPAAGTGWWSPLLAAKGELWAFGADARLLDRARERLLAHGLRAHLQVRDPWAEPTRRADALFAAFGPGGSSPGRREAFVGLARRWLRAGGTCALVDLRAGADRGPAAELGIEPGDLAAVLARAGFDDAEVTSTGRYFVLARARA